MCSPSLEFDNTKGTDVLLQMRSLPRPTELRAVTPPGPRPCFLEAWSRYGKVFTDGWHPAPDAPAMSPRPQLQATVPFAASDVFGGPCAGFVFKTGDKELGYYSEEEEDAATDGSRGAMDAIKYDLPPMDEFQARKAMTGPEIDGRRELLTWGVESYKPNRGCTRWPSGVSGKPGVVTWPSFTPLGVPTY